MATMELSNATKDLCQPALIHSHGVRITPLGSRRGKSPATRAEGPSRSGLSGTSTIPRYASCRSRIRSDAVFGNCFETLTTGWRSHGVSKRIWLEFFHCVEKIKTDFNVSK